MKNTTLFFAAALAAMLLASGSASAQNAKVELKDAKGAMLGTVGLTEVPTGVLLAVSLKGVLPGVHGFHIHTVGKCDGPAFATASPCARAVRAARPSRPSTSRAPWATPRSC